MFCTFTILLRTLRVLPLLDLNHKKLTILLKLNANISNYIPRCGWRRSLVSPFLGMLIETSIALVVYTSCSAGVERASNIEKLPKLYSKNTSSSRFNAAMCFVTFAGSIFHIFFRFTLFTFRVINIVLCNN